MIGVRSGRLHVWRRAGKRQSVGLRSCVADRVEPPITGAIVADTRAESTHVETTIISGVVAGLGLDYFCSVFRRSGRRDKPGDDTGGTAAGYMRRNPDCSTC